MVELEFNDIEDVSGPEDVDFPSHIHHFKVRSELSKLVKEGVLTNDEADEAYDNWREERQ